MKKLFMLTVAVGCMIAGSSPLAAHDFDVNTIDARASRGAFRPGEVIVKFKPTSNVAMKAPVSTRFKSSKVNEVDRVFSKIGVAEVAELMPLSGAKALGKSVRSYTGKIIEASPMERAYVLTLSNSSANVIEAVEALRTLGEVEYAEPNYLVYALDGEITDTPDDTYYSLQYGLDAINMPQLWAKPVITKDGPIIAILDTGVDITHPDLEANIWTNTAEANGASGYDDDRNGFADDIHGWDFVNQTGDIHDYNGHGTHCAGIAAACGFNGVGIVGANPDARIMPLTVLQSNGQGDIATIIKAIDYAAANGADIISMSLGTYSTSIALEEALGRAYQKSVIVAAAGNDGYCLNHRHPENCQIVPMPMFPAAYTFVLGVQASSTIFNLASFSNYDDDGPIFSPFGEEKLYNYELTAPGVSIVSTYPGGGYKLLNGTSMATPLVAGAVSRLLQCKEYINKEELFGDLINSVTSKGDLDILAAYNLTDKDRKPELQFVTIDMADADGDGRADAGETVEFYPVIRNSWGNATNIRYTIDSAEPVNTTFTVEQAEADFGLSLSSYGKGRALNPVRIKFNPDVVDGRIVRLKFTVEADNMKPIEQEFELTVVNAIELTGILKEDMTLTPDQHYIVNATFGVPEGITLTILPGTTIKLRDFAYMKVDGNLIADGEPGNMITFTKADLEQGNITVLDFGKNDLSYCIFEHLVLDDQQDIILNKATKCIYRNLFADWGINYRWENSSIYNVESRYRMNQVNNKIFKSNFVNCSGGLYPGTSSMKGVILTETSWDHQIYGPQSCNIFNNSLYELDINNNKVGYDLINGYSFTLDMGMTVYTPDEPCYLGTSLLETAQKRVMDVNNPFAIEGLMHPISQYDFSNMPTKPYAEAPGIVWKVLVNGKDAQDEFDEMPALGVGTHTFKVYFNRLMNTEVIPTVAMGLRPPYTQTAIGESGEWSVEDGVSVYTAKVTISGKTSIDGLNRIYVAGAEDDEYFPIPVEDTRFNVLVQAAGSLSSGFMAEAGLGRVTLTWDNEEEDNIDDILGYNMYRYEIDSEGNASDTICVNRQLLEPKEEMLLTDYDVVPRHTYAYFYKTMRTDMSETSPSKTVAVTPLTASAGDANGSGGVDVADVITTVNYASGLNPQPFIFEAADMNTDLAIDILDVVGIIRTILYPNSAASLSAEATATYYMDEDGIIYVETPVALAGLQLNLTLNRNGSVRGLDAIKGFEQTGAWLNDNDYIFLAYNMTGRTIEPGRHAVAVITGGVIDDILLSDSMGANVKAIYADDTTGVEDVCTDTETKRFADGIYNLIGIKISDNADDIDSLPAGIYIVNGQKVVK